MKKILSIALLSLLLVCQTTFAMDNQQSESTTFQNRLAMTTVIAQLILPTFIKIAGEIPSMKNVDYNDPIITRALRRLTNNRDLILQIPQLKDVPKLGMQEFLEQRNNTLFAQVEAVQASKIDLNNRMRANINPILQAYCESINELERTGSNPTERTRLIGILANLMIKYCR